MKYLRLGRVRPSMAERRLGRLSRRALQAMQLTGNSILPKVPARRDHLSLETVLSLAGHLAEIG
jgi:DNA-binding CsgD family transcriptional regulator